MPPKVKTPKLPPIPEAEVQSTAIKVFEAFGCIVHRRNTGAMTMQAEGNWKRRFVRFSEPGASDLWALTPAGVHCEAEIKRAGERPTLDQVNWLLRHNGVGTSVAWWSDSAESVERVLRHVLSGGRIEYLDTTRAYPVKVKGKTIRVEGPSGDFYLA